MKIGKFKKFLPFIILVVVAAIIVPIFYINYLPADEVKKVNALQTQISELSTQQLSFEKKETVDTLLKNYSQLSEKAKKKIDYSSIEAISNTLKENMIKETMEAIDQIGSVTLTSKDKIREARSYYNQIDKSFQENITNYSLLENAETTYSDLSVSNVVNIINQIGTVTLNSNDIISQAKIAYYALDENDRAKVSNAETIVTAQNQFNKLQQEKQIQEAAAKKAAQQAAVSKMKAETDKVEGITWYKSGNQPYYANSRSFVLPYIGADKYHAWLRIKFHYTGDSWIFFTNITIVIDGEKYYKSFDYYDVLRDNGSGDVWEVADIPATDSDIGMLKQIADSAETIVRFEGSDYYYDLTVKKSDKSAIKDVLNAYEALK